MTKSKIQKQKWKAGNMIYPLPAVMISCGDEEKTNIVTVAWTGTICTNPPMTYISLRKSRYSYDMIKDTGYFVINLTTRDLAYVTDFCGVRSGRDLDKFKEMNLTPIWDEDTKCPMIGESPVSVVCKVREIKELGSHDLFIADVLNVYVQERLLDQKGKFHLNAADLIAYSHGTYLTLGDEIGTFGYSVRKKTDTVKAQKPQKMEASKSQREGQVNTLEKVDKEKSHTLKSKKITSSKNKKVASRKTDQKKWQNKDTSYFKKEKKNSNKKSS